MSAIRNLIGKKSIEKEVKKMRNVLALLMAITLAFSTTGIAFADFTPIDSEIFEASSGVIGGKADVTVGFEAKLKNLSDDLVNTTGIAWDAVTAGTTGWLTGNQYVAVKGFATYSDWGIQVYTDNDNYTGTGNPAGLVREDNTIYSLPVCWRTKVGYYDSSTKDPKKTGSESITAQEKEIYEGTAYGYTVLYDGVPGHEPDGTKEYFPWFFMLDKNTPDVDLTTPDDQPFGNYQQEATFMGSAGYHHAPGDVAVNFATPSNPNDTYYVYLGAKFTMAVPGKTYSTDTLTVEMYHL